MPRKYRPPAKRRAARKTTVPYAFDPGPEDGGSVDFVDNEAEFEVEEPIVAATSSARFARGTPLTHLTRDYGYVRAEVLRIAVVAGFLIISLVITSILRD